MINTLYTSAGDLTLSICPQLKPSQNVIKNQQTKKTKMIHFPLGDTPKTLSCQLLQFYFMM